MRQQLRQAAAIINSAWQRNLAYRFTVVTYRLGEIIEIVVLVLMWTAIYAAGTTTIKGFSLNEMITYVLIGNVFSAAVRNFIPGYVSRDIEQGRLSMFLVRPISYMKFVFINELGRSFLATLLSVLTQIGIVLLFLDRVVINNDPGQLLLILIMVFLAVIIELLLGFLIGTIAFWTDETDGLHTTIERVKRFFSGGYFPLALLPAALATVSFYLPFQYSFYAPAMLYLGKLSFWEGVTGLLVQLAWIALLSVIVSIVWKMGLKRYEAAGS
ncbi:MAG: viologen exporter family transport system permease protein [Candidatus Parcubacteria bacterium]|jgi:ABC-2 type transport system permease protein|nr:viologen exporter family transport system permease protein [Candidatus Parcubacteria bacterium]